jgi:hypothetical protein
MLAVFCLRLACGMIACLLLLPPAQVNPRFFRTHFLTALGLTAVAAVFLREQASLALWLALAGAMACTFLGSMVWMVEGAPLGRTLIALSVPMLAASLVLAGKGSLAETENFWLVVADDFAAAAVLGAATTAMLMGHSYLIAPAMSLTPLLRLLGLLGICLVVRMALAGAGLWSWTGQQRNSNLETEMLLWLPVRWALGFVAPLVLGWMAWETAKIRSTQSATGILYVVVILCFLAELTSQLLMEKTGYIL